MTLCSISTSVCRAIIEIYIYIMSIFYIRSKGESYRLDAGEHAHVSGEVCGFEHGVVVPPEIHVHHERLQLLRDHPRLVLHVPTTHTHTHTKS